MQNGFVILIIESHNNDIFKIENIFKNFLSKRIHYQLTIAHSLSEAREILESNKSFDLIITDLKLPDKNDYDVIRSLQEISSNIPIITISDAVDEEMIRQIIRLGAQDFLPKNELDPSHLLRVIYNTIERNHLRKSLRALSFTDEMTGLYNRRGFYTLLEQQISISNRSKKGFYLFIIDLDYLKQINDTYGHSAGDQAIMDLADCLLIAMRHHDIIGRLGGDEFGVIAINAAVDSEAHIKENIERRIQQRNGNTAEPYQLQMSIGAAYYSGNEELTIGELIHLADINLYKAKRETHSRRPMGE